jgi:hypothetical protein
MKKFKGTTGEWTVRETKRAFKIDSPIHDGMARVWKIKDFPEHDEQALADATMMVASKDLYNALVMVMDAVQWESLTQKGINIFNKANAALNKAVTVELF